MKKNKIGWLCLTVALTTGVLVAMQLCYLITVVA